MSVQSDDKTILALLEKAIGQKIEARAEYNNNGQLIMLNLPTLGLTQIPAELGQLSNLQILYLNSNQLTEIPAELGQFSNLQELYLYNNELTEIPTELGQLSNLRQLYLYYNKLTEIPTELGQLSNLQTLSLNNNQLTQVPSAIGQLTRLQELPLDNNRLTLIPPEISQLSNLQLLSLNNNQLLRLPVEIGQLPNLKTLQVNNNVTLLTPPPEIIARETADIMTFLQDLQANSITRYESKLLIVGEGAVGKSSLIHRLKSGNFQAGLPMTHGIEVNQLKIPYNGKELLLDTWDFGGQHIYHTTHQFFLTQRSLYLLVWNARAGAVQGRLDYWLDTIRTLAPHAPILLVATHIDELPHRVPDLNYQYYQQRYPQQLVGNFAISNSDGGGIDTIRQAIAEQAWKLPFMGQPWPQKWIAVETLLTTQPEPHINVDRYIDLCAQYAVSSDLATGSLGNYLHDLGKILYFQDDEWLRNRVILQPNWVTQAMARVLDSPDVVHARGILEHSNLARLWVRDDAGRIYERHLHPFLLRMMERFELSYQITSDLPGEDRKRSLVPLLLPYQPPIQLPPWPTSPQQDQALVKMVYKLDFVPAGIMSRFIVRTHRYTRGLHWRDGVLLTYERHDARIELHEAQKEIILLVEGPLPQNFFTILMNTMNDILARFEGLVVKREIPCICHWTRSAGQPCPRSYQYEDLVRRMEASRRRETIECPEYLVDVSVPTLLYGIHRSTNAQVMEDLQRGLQELATRQGASQSTLDSISHKVDQQSELIIRNFTRQWNFAMAQLEAECPNTFMLTAGNKSIFNPKNWVSQEYRLTLLCQHSPQPHPVGEAYSLRQVEEWWVKLSPWLNYLIQFLKVVAPIGTDIVQVALSKTDADNIQYSMSLIKDIIGALPQLPGLDHHTKMPMARGEQEVTGPALRALHSYLESVDKEKTWGGLHKTPTPEGHVLWLCGQHRQEFEAKSPII